MAQGESPNDLMHTSHLEIGRDTMALIERWLKREITREQYVEALRNLDLKYPDHTLRGERTSGPNSFAEAADMLEYAVQRDAARGYAEEVTEWRR